MDQPAEAIETAPAPLAALQLIDSFRLVVDGRSPHIPHSVERLLAYLALADSAIPRTRLARELWAGADHERAASNLRTTLWRMRTISRSLVRRDHQMLALSPQVDVDVHRIRDLTRQVMQGDAETAAAVSALSPRQELLPQWGDIWVTVERERLHLLRLQALEVHAGRLIDEGKFADALRAATEAIHAEPLRESARRLVVRVYLEEGNVAQAVRSYSEYAQLLHDELGIAPSPMMRRLLAPVLG